MKIAIKYLKSQLDNQIEDLRINKLMLNDKSNSFEMNQYFKDNIEENKKAIESLRKAISHLKTLIVKSMNREIKFKAFDKSKNVMFEIFDSSAQKDWFLPAWKENFVVMQYSGLKDKNGKEIYENDVVIFENKFYRVEFNDGAFCLVNDILQIIISMYDYRSSEYEVIGNIYQNPELMQ